MVVLVVVRSRAYIVRSSRSRGRTVVVVVLFLLAHPRRRPRRRRRRSTYSCNRGA